MDEAARKNRFSAGTKIALAAFAALALLAAGTAFLALTDPGHRTLERAANALTGGEVRISGLSGTLFDRVAAKRIEISDKNGMWLAVDRLEMSWRALALVRNRADIRTLTASRVTVLRRPVSKRESSEGTFRIDIGRLDVAEARFAKAAFGHAGTLRLAGSLQYRSRTDAALKLAARRLDGAGRYQADLKMRKGVLTGTADIDEAKDGFVGALIGLPDIGPVRLRLRAKPGRDGLTLALTAGALRASLKGDADLSAKHLDARFALDAPAMAPRPDLSWRALTASGTIAGPFARLKVQGALAVEDLTAAMARAGSIAATASGRDGRIALSGRIADLRIAGDGGVFAGSPVAISARIDQTAAHTPLSLSVSHPLMTLRGYFQHTDGWRGTLHFEAPRLEPLAGLVGVPLAGRARFDGSLNEQGGALGLRLDGEIAATGTALPARLLGRSRIEISAARETDSIRGRISWHGGALAGEIRGSYRQDRPSGEAELTFNDLSALSPKLAGTLRLRAELDDAAEQKLTATGNGRIAVAGGKAEPIALTLDVADPLRHPAGTLRLKGHFAGAPVEISAKRTATGRIDLDRLTWKSLAGRGHYLPGKRPQAQADLSFGHLADLAPFVPGLSGRAEAHLRLGAGGRRAELLVRAENLASGETKIGTVVLTGGIDAPLTAPHLALTLSLPQLSVAGMTGAVAGTVSGPADAPEAALAVNLATDAGSLRLDTRARYESDRQKLTVAAMRLQWNGKTLRLSAPATLTRTKDGTHVNVRLTGDKAATLTAQGRIPADATQTYALHVAGAGELGDWTGFLSADGRSVRGHLSFAADLRGRSEAPEVFGSARLENGRYQDFSTGISLHKIDAALSAAGSRIRIERLSATAHGGRITATGSLDTTDPMPVDIRFSADKARPFARDGMKVTLSGEGRIAGALKGDLSVQGDLTIPKGEIRIPDKLPVSIAVLDVRRKNAPPAPPPSMGRIALALTITSPGQFFIRGHGLEAELEGRLRIAGTTSAPRIEGKLTMRSGTYALSGNPLEFESGSISFTGADLDPSLDFTAETTSDSITATLKITGTATHPKIALTSSPTLPQDEILAQLLFQQSTDELSPVQLAQIAQSLAGLSGLDSGVDPVGLVRSSLGLDKLTVGSGTDSSTTVEAGKYVLRHVYVGAKQDLSGGTRAEVQVDLGRRLKLRASVNAAGETAVPTTTGDKGDTVGLTYQFDY